MFPPSAWIPNGAKPLATFASLKPPDVATGANDASKMSTRALWKSAAYRRSFAVASPVYNAPTLERSAPTTAVVPFTDGVQPRIIPLFVANRNLDAPLLPPWLTTKSVALPLKTVPVGPPGTDTVSGTFAPAPLYSVEVLEPLFADHQGVVGPALSPQPLTSDASVAGAAVALLSDTSGLTLYALAVTRLWAAPAATETMTANAASTSNLTFLLGMALSPVADSSAGGSTRAGGASDWS